MAQAAGGISSNWLVLVAQLPEEATARMRILRTLESLGCALLGESAFIVPDTVASRQGLPRLGEHITSSGGSYHLLHVVAEPDQARTFAALFDRSARYDDLIKSVEALRSGFGVSDPTTLSRTLIKFRRELDGIESLDFFPSEIRQRAKDTLASMERNIRGLLFPGNADITSTQEIRARQKFFRRIWVTRRPLWADRLASAWLIRRFIDAEAKVFWGERDQAAPESAVTFGYEGAMFSNAANKVTYEVLLESFGLA